MYAITGMPLLSAWSVGALNAVLSIRQQPIPFALAAMALLNAETIWLTIELLEPVHWNEEPVSAQASWHPYCVAVKNEFVVTWQTITNLWLLLVPKTPLAPPPVVAALELEPLLEPHASSTVAAIAAAPPVSAVRRVICRQALARAVRQLALVPLEPLDCVARQIVW